jgi:hypothetical protein
VKDMGKSKTRRLDESSNGIMSANKKNRGEQVMEERLEAQA